MNFQEACVLWLRQILNSGYPEDMRYLMASSAVVFFGKQLGSPFAEQFNHIHSAALRPFLDSLLLSERLYPTESPPYPGVIALRILSIETGRGDFDLAILPVLTSTLLPTHPLQSRRLALKFSQRPDLGRFSPQAEAFSSVERARLLEIRSNLPQIFPRRMGNQRSQPIMILYRARPLDRVCGIGSMAGSVGWMCTRFLRYASRGDCIGSLDSTRLRGRRRLRQGNRRRRYRAVVQKGRDGQYSPCSS